MRLKRYPLELINYFQPNRRNLATYLLSTVNYKAKEVVKHTKCGIHSGFKPCCIAWFSFVWWNWLELEDRGYLPHKASDCYRRFTKPVFSDREYVGYIVCPKCALFEDYVEVKRCDCGDIISEHYESGTFWATVSWDFLLRML